MTFYPFIYEELVKQMKEEDIRLQEVRLELPIPCLEYEDPIAQDLMIQTYSPCNKCPESICNNGSCGYNGVDLCMLPIFYGVNFTFC